MMAGTAGNVKPSRTRSTPESGSTDRAKWVFGGGAATAAVEEVRKANILHSEDHEMRRIKEAQKAEKLIHLVCWGPK
ncbi:hypothetical protein CDL12_13139 [Handroanthus impetiginosus]|uniref:Uncharacterized protein n=1 Tax=Handroanthus impetiginosus TaxID=429701 RepID=A0A2G9H9N8_9LAMI|nr:hypothetical protein CDL12_13139 [Handroanthus impetiginosus]